jgi:hypothetical protein
MNLRFLDSVTAVLGVWDSNFEAYILCWIKARTDRGRGCPFLKKSARTDAGLLERQRRTNWRRHQNARSPATYVLAEGGDTMGDDDCTVAWRRHELSPRRLLSRSHLPLIPVKCQILLSCNTVMIPSGELFGRCLSGGISDGT